MKSQKCEECGKKSVIVSTSYSNGVEYVNEVCLMCGWYKHTRYEQLYEGDESLKRWRETYDEAFKALKKKYGKPTIPKLVIHKK